MHIPDELYATIESSIPITCVDIVLWRGETKPEELGLILRDSPFGQVWCHLGGRIQYGELVRDAIDRHVSQSLGEGIVHTTADMQPDYVYQWFPPSTEGAASSDPHGEDPRKHSVALSYALQAERDPIAQPESEALRFEWFAPDSLPSPLWPGAERMIRRVWAAAEEAHRRHTT